MAKTKLAKITAHSEDEQFWRPKSEGGADWSSLRRVLAVIKYSNNILCELWWWEGGCYWSGMCGMQYSKARLCGATPPKWSCHNSVGGAGTYTHDFQVGGRLSMKLLKEKAEDIDKHFKV
jgi:hypothetical protein